MIKRNILLTFALLVAISVVAQPKIVAHKGYYQKGVVPSNSIEALKRAQNEGFDIVEFDVNMSADGELLVLHGDWHPSQKAKNKVHAQHDTKEAIQAILLSNSEKVPTFEEWMAQAAKCDKTKMLIEIKGHDSPAIDAKSEGWVLGVAAKMFTIAGPVIVFGTASSVVYGVIYRLWTVL